jgi:hypothetical protein
MDVVSDAVFILTVLYPNVAMIVFVVGFIEADPVENKTACIVSRLEPSANMWPRLIVVVIIQLSELNASLKVRGVIITLPRLIRSNVKPVRGLPS